MLKFIKFNRINVIIITPFELLKCQQQLVEEKFVPLKVLLKDNFQKRGLFGLYKGFSATFNRDVLSYGFYFSSFYKQRDYLIENNLYTSFRIMLAGGISGI